MNQERILNGRTAQVIAYFEFTTTNDTYIIYNYPTETNVIYIGQVKENNIQLFDKQTVFIIKALIKELSQKQLGTIKAYKYLSKMKELPTNLTVSASQKIELTEEGIKNTIECLTYIEQHNQEILEQATDEYYLKLLDEQTKDRRTIIALVTILILTLSAIAYMIINFLHQY